MIVMVYNGWYPPGWFKRVYTDLSVRGSPMIFSDGSYRQVTDAVKALELRPTPSSRPRGFDDWGARNL